MNHPSNRHRTAQELEAEEKESETKGTSKTSSNQKDSDCVPINDGGIIPSAGKQLLRNEVMGDLTEDDTNEMTGETKQSSDTQQLQGSSFIDFGQTSEESMRRFRNMHQNASLINPFVGNGQQQRSAPPAASGQGTAAYSSTGPNRNTSSLTNVECSIPAKTDNNTRSLFFLSTNKNRFSKGTKQKPEKIKKPIEGTREDLNTDTLPFAPAENNPPPPDTKDSSSQSIQKINSISSSLEQEVVEPNEDHYSRNAKNRLPGLVQPGAYDATPGLIPARIRSIRSSEIMEDMSNTTGRGNATTSDINTMDISNTERGENPTGDSSSMDANIIPAGSHHPQTTDEEAPTTTNTTTVSNSNAVSIPGAVAGLVEARKIQSQAEILAKAKSIRPEREEAKQRKRQLALFVPLGILFLVAVLIVVIVLGAMGLFSSKQEVQPLIPATDIPTSAPSASPTAFLLPLPHYTVEAIEMDPMSPQSQAYQWLRDDPMLDTYKEKKMLQRFALATFFFACGGFDWVLNNRWLSYERNGDECDWMTKSQGGGGACDADGNYIALVLTKNGLSGSLPPELSLLSHLEVLDVATNSMGGKIPTQIGLMTALKELILDVNQLTGEVPSEVGRLSLLALFFVHTNPLLTGTIHTEVGLLTNMIDLEWGDTSTSGTIPRQLGLLTKMTYLYLGSTFLGGTLPSEMGLIKDLSEMHLDSNNLGGKLPSELWLLNKLTFLYLENNSLSGTVPTEVGLLKELSGINLYSNHFNGAIPSQFGALTKLTYLDLDYNALSSTVPMEIYQNLQSMRYLYLSSNNLTGTLPTELGLLSNIEYLWINHNGFNWTIPSEVGVLSSLSYFKLGDTDISGQIPSEITNLFALQFLDLNNTLLTGVIPSELCEISDLNFSCSAVFCGCSCDCDATALGNATWN